MPITANPYLRVLASWPVQRDELFDPTIPSPWREVPVPESPDPLRPTISLLFSRALSDEAVANDNAVSSYFFLTSLTNPAEANIQSFEALTWDGVTNVLTFRPTVPLIPGTTYWATVLGTLTDSSGRRIQAPYSWAFDIDAGLYQGLPIPVLMSPIDQSVIIKTFFPISWGIDPNYVLPSGQSLYFDLKIGLDANFETVVWTGEILSTAAQIPASGTTLNTYSFYPSFAPSGLVSPQGYYYSIACHTEDASGNVLNQSFWSAGSYFYYDFAGNSPESASTTTPGQDTYPGILQTNPIVSANEFQVTGVSPQPGSINQDVGVEVQPIYIYPFGYF